jgi:hypothetical protein
MKNSGYAPDAFSTFIKMNNNYSLKNSNGLISVMVAHSLFFFCGNRRLMFIYLDKFRTFREGSPLEYSTVVPTVCRVLRCRILTV